MILGDVNLPTPLSKSWSLSHHTSDLGWHSKFLRSTESGNFFLVALGLSCSTPDLQSSLLHVGS